MVYQDGSEYRGGLINGVKNGYGLYIWPKEANKSKGNDLTKIGHIYIGNWKEGAMNGEGRFQHRNGFVIEPTFSNNLALISDGTFINPFMT